MLTNAIIEVLNKKQNGSWFNAEWTTDIPLSAQAKKEGHTAYKTTTAQCRKGINYASQKSVQMKVDHGHQLTHELPWGQWKQGHEGLILEHKGVDYVRLYLGPNKASVDYYLDGEKVTWDALKESGLVLNSFFNKPSERPDCISIKAANLKVW